jgi:hypothetical protein
VDWGTRTYVYRQETGQPGTGEGGNIEGFRNSARQEIQRVEEQEQKRSESIQGIKIREHKPVSRNCVRTIRNQRRQGTHSVQEQEQVRTKARRERNQSVKLNCQETGSKAGKIQLPGTVGDRADKRSGKGTGRNKKHVNIQVQEQVGEHRTVEKWNRRMHF